MEITSLAKDHWEWVELMQWHNKTPLEYLALICAEVGEAVNECRGTTPTDKLPSELADIILRTLDLMQELDYDIENIIYNKIIHNKLRGTKGRIK